MRWKLRQHLHTQMQITAKGTDEREKKLGELKAQNENLRVMVQGLQQKPERATARTLEVWQRALERMTGRAPGFAQAGNKPWPSPKPRWRRPRVA